MVIRAILGHLALVGISVGLALLIGLPLGLVASFKPSLKRPLLYIMTFLQWLPIPGVIALFFVLPVSANFATLLALTIFSLGFVARGITEGLNDIGNRLQEMSEAVGMTSGKAARIIWIPIALPSLLDGLRRAFISSTVAAVSAGFFGGAGLGKLIVQGVSTSSPMLIWESIVWVVLIAIAAYAGLSVAKRQAVADINP